MNYSQNGNSGNKKGAFIAKLVAMLNDPSLGHLIRWSGDGRAFIVTHQEEFAQKALSSYFRHRNFSSFVRQMHLYGFKKVSIQNGAIQFSHPDFLLGRDDLVSKISRKPGMRIRHQVSSLVVKEEMNDVDVSGELTNISSLRGQLEELREQNRRLAQANEDLQRQVYNLQGPSNSFGYGEDLDNGIMDMKLDYNEDAAMSGMTSFVPVYPVLPKLEDGSPRASSNHGLVGLDFMMPDQNSLGENWGHAFEFNDSSAFGFQDELGFGF